MVEKRLTRSGVEGSTFSVSAVVLEFNLTRKSGYYMRTCIIPTVFIWFLSWGGMFIAPSAVPARAAMAIIPFLVLTNMLSSVRAGLPPLAEDVWLTGYVYGQQWLVFLQAMAFCMSTFLLDLLAKCAGCARWMARNFTNYFIVLALLAFIGLNVVFF